MASGVYAIPKIEAESRGVVTNTTPDRPVPRRRAAGGDAGDRARDGSLRRRARARPRRGATPQLHRRRRVPVHHRVGRRLRLRRLRARARPRARRRPATRRCATSSGSGARRATPRALGIGVSVYVEITNGLVEPEFGAVEITPEGEAILRTGSFSHGQGHETTFAMIVADRLGPPARVGPRASRAIPTRCVRAPGTYGSKSTQIGGVAAGAAAESWSPSVRASWQPSSSRRAVDDVVLDARRRRLPRRRVADAGVSWAELASRAARRRAARRAAGRGDLQRRGADVPVRRARRRRRGRHRDGRGRAPAPRRRRRRRHASSTP